MNNENEIDIKTLKYVLYARKSTDDPQRQARSIDDQIAECKQLAQRLGISIAMILTEKQSAKKPGKRPVFRQMLKDIGMHKYNAILAWNPDRLARNMKEGGEVIDMVDENIIQDMKFVTHHFSKDANGKMLLGMAFVLSKQYSDNLSQNVTRGMNRKFQEGRSHIPKHGYVFDDTGVYSPDGHNFELICDAWQMRKRGESLEEISNYMNKNGYGRIVKKDDRKIPMSIKIITGIFHDPFYYGILIQGGQKVDLMSAYKFTSVVSEEEYNQVQELSTRRLKPFNTNRRLTFYPLKTMVICSFCNHNMVVGPSTSSHGKRLLYYRCDNKLCGRIKRSIRAKIVFDAIYKILEEGLNLTKNEYDQYYSSLNTLTEAKREKLSLDIHSLEGSLKAIKSEAKERSLNLVTTRVSDTARGYNEERIAELETRKEEIEQDIVKLKAQITSPQEDRLSLEQFLNLAENAVTVVKSGNPLVKDAICRLIFLNFTVDEEKMLSFQAKPPFDEMLKVHSIPSSRGGGN